MSELGAKVKEEVAKLLPPTIFFLVALHLVAILRSLMLAGTGISLVGSAQTTLGALILGKAVLIADMLPMINRYPDKPLVFNIGWKTAIYTAIAIVIHYLERLFDFSKQAGGLVPGNHKLLAEMVWSHFWALQIFLFTLILMYCTAREVIRAVGAHAVRKMFFGPL
jgi:hypothetical protein